MAAFFRKKIAQYDGKKPAVKVVDENGLLEAGDPSAPAVLFLHAGTLDRHSMVLSVENLSDSYHTLAIDLPGHGTLSEGATWDNATGTGENVWSMDASIDLIHRTIEKHAAEGRAVLVGMSLGGYCALEMARRHPQAVAGLFLSGCTSDMTGRCSEHSLVVAETEEAYLEMLERGRLQHSVQLVMDIADVIFRRCVRKRTPPCTPQNMPPLFQDLNVNHRSYLEALGSYTGAVAVVNGEGDVGHTTNSQDVDRIRGYRDQGGLVSGSSMLVQAVPGRHLWNFDFWDEYNTMVRLLANEAYADLDDLDDVLLAC